MTWRKGIFTVHLWSGIGLGLYVLVASVTGSILVFSNELYRMATREPVVVADRGTALTDEQLRDAALRTYPGYTIFLISRGGNPSQAVAISLRTGGRMKNRLFNPYTGLDLGDSVPVGIRMVSRMTELHDDLLAGPTGRKVNGAGAALLLMLGVTGIVVWWPQKTLKVRMRRFARDVHSVIGIWSVGFLVIFGVSGIYLANPEPWQDLADRIEPATAANAGLRTVDLIIYWLAYLHFGRVNGIGIPCSGPGICDMTTKFVWAAFGLAPAAMFATGVVMWWKRVVRKKGR